MKKSFLLVLAALVLMVGSAFAQSGAFAPYVDAGISGSSTLTASSSVTAINPNYTVGAGIESSTKYLLLDVHANFNSQNYRTFGISAIGSGDSYAATVQGTGFLKVGKLLLGGGTFYQDTVTAKTIRGLFPNAGQTFVPLIGGGFQFSRDRITALYELPGRSATNQRTVDFHNEVFLTKKGHLRLTQDISLNTAVQNVPTTNITQRISGGSAGVGLKLVF
jgi:hypothetical protein